MPKISKGVGSSLTQKEMAIAIKKNEGQIKQLENSVSEKRRQLQNLSKNITKMIEKKVIYKKNGQQPYKHPNFNPQYEDPELTYYINWKQQLYGEIQEFKHKINAIKDSHEPAVINEHHHKQNIIVNLDKELQKLSKQRAYIQHTMEDNKQILQAYKQNQCINDIETNMKILEELKKQAKILDRQWNELNAEEIQQNVFIFQYQGQIKKIQNPEPIQPGDEPVPAQTIQELIAQINMYTEQRKTLEKKSESEIAILNRNITNLLHQNKQIQKKIRILQSEKMKKELQIRHIREKREKKERMRKQKELEEQKFQKRIHNLQKSIPENFKKNYQSIFPITQHNYQSHEINQAKEEEKRDTMFMVETDHKNVTNRDNQKQIVIGSWVEQHAIKDIESLASIHNSILAKAVFIHFYIEKETSEEQIKDIQVTYLDVQGKEHTTRGVNGKQSGALSKDLLSKKVEEIVIDLQEVEDMRFMPEESKVLGIKWIMRDGKVIQIGNFSEESSNQLISFTQYSIEEVEFSLDGSLNCIAGLLIKLKQRKMNKSKNESGTNSPMPKWRSTSEVSLLTKKKIFVKPSPQKKRSSELPKVDHRLLLNRRNKMV